MFLKGKKKLILVWCFYKEFYSGTDTDKTISPLVLSLYSFPFCNQEKILES